MKQYDITIIDLASAVLQVRSYFAKRGVKITVTKKKAQKHFTSGPVIPIVVKDHEGGKSSAKRLLDRKRVSSRATRDSA